MQIIIVLLIFQFKVHVNTDFNWTGQDPLEIFRLEKKVGEGLVYYRNTFTILMQINWN